MAKESFMGSLRKEIGIQSEPEEIIPSKSVNTDNKDTNISSEISKKEVPKKKEEEVSEVETDEEEELGLEGEEELEDENSDDEDEPEEDDDEDEKPLSLNKNKKEKEKDKKLQFSQLRKSKEEWKRKYNELEAKYNSLAKTSSEESSKILSLIEEKIGKVSDITPDQIESLFSASEERDAIREELESIKMDNDIRTSSTWKNEYETPYNDSIEAFYATIVNTDESGKVVNEPIFQEFAKSLMESAFKNGSINATQVKTAIKKFTKFYEDRTGEEYEEPLISDVVKSIRSAITHRNRAEEAYNNWEKNKIERDRSSKLEESEKSERLKKIQKKERKALASKALNEFDINSLDGIFDEEDITEEFNNAFIKNEEQMEDPSKSIPYDSLMSIIVKGRLFDSLLAKYKKDTDYKSNLSKLKKGVKGSEKPSVSERKENRAPGERSWLKV